MNFLKNPTWYSKIYNESKTKSQEERINAINKRLSEKNNVDPIVSVNIIAYNEEANIINCVDSLSRLQTEIPYEINIIDNNSNDSTWQIVNLLNVNGYQQPIQGWGPARQKGLEKSKGKYIFCGDADCFYPPRWIELLHHKLSQPGVACVYGQHSYITESRIQRFKINIYEIFRELVAKMRSYKVPHLNVLGLNMAFVRAYGLEIGYDQRKMRGEDGRLAFDLMKYGKIKRINNTHANVWTSYRTLLRDGSLLSAFKKRIVKELLRFREYLSEREDHDTKSSQNKEWRF